MGEEKTVVMGGGGDEVVVNDEEVISGESSLSTCGTAEKPFAASKGAGHEGGVASGADIREEPLEVIADTRKVIIDGVGVNMVTHEDSKKAECFGGRVNGAVVEAAEGEVGVGG